MISPTVRFAFLHAEDGQKLVPVAGCPCPLRRDQVAEELPDDRDPLFADSLERGLGMLSQSTADTTDVLVSLARLQAPFAVAGIP